MLDRRVHQCPHEGESFVLFCSLLFEPPRPADSQVSARRVSNKQIPSESKHFPNIALHMQASVRLGRQKIARHRQVASAEKRIAHHARKLTRDENPHDAALREIG
jgi:hypothetical protein